MALTKLNNKAVANVTTLPVSLGDMVFVSSATASSSASIEFSLGNYKEYKFFFVNMHPSNNDVLFTVNFSTDGGSNYNVAKTTTSYFAYHSENDASTSFGYADTTDAAQSTADVQILGFTGNGNDESSSGKLHLFNPSSTTYVKHFICAGNDYYGADFSINRYIAGYANTPSALTNIRFKMSSGNIDAGKILMFGIN